MSQRKRFALVTGQGCGKRSIGEAYTADLIEKGFEVFATVLPTESSDHLERTGCHVCHLDVTDNANIESLHEKVGKMTEGYLDILVNNAAIYYRYPAVDSDIDIVKKIFAVNIIGPICMVKRFHKMIIEAKGIIVNTGCLCGVCTSVYSSAYGASKAALHQYGNILRNEMAPLGVKVVNIITGEVDTDLFKADKSRFIEDGSVYAPLAHRFREHLAETRPRMSPKQYATSVVPRLLSLNPPAKIWCGTGATLVWIFDAFFPNTVFDFFARRIFHLEELRNNVVGAYRSPRPAKLW